MSQTTDARIYFSEGQARTEFSARVLHFTAPQLSRMSGCSTDATRRWIDGSRGPNTASVINIARCLPAVQDWIAARCNIERSVQANSYDAWVAGLYAIAACDPAAREAIRVLGANNLLPATPVERPLGNLDWQNARGAATEQIARDGMVLIEKRIARGPEQDRASAARCEGLAREIDAEFEVAKDRDF